MLLEGMQIGRYQFIHVLGSGGMGEVYLAENARIGQQIAIKVIPAEASPYPDEKAAKEATRLFQREAMAIATLDHPHILPLFDYGEGNINSAILTYLVLQFRQEGSLVDWSQRRGGRGLLSPQDVANIIGQMADALQLAHDHQIIHQDVKPFNLLIRERKDAPNRPEVLLADFGIAKSATATASTSQVIRGTPTYMVPEQWEAHPVSASDQYALAIMTYELLPGRPPFQAGSVQMMYQHFKVRPQPPSTLNRHLSSDVDAVLLNALTKKSADRAQLAQPASTYSQANQVSQSPVSWQPRSPQSPGAYTPSPASAPNAQPYPVQPPLVLGSQNADRHPRRRRGCMIGCLSVLVIFVVLGAFLIVTSQKVLAFGSAISTQSPLSTQTGYMNTSDRVNILIVGYSGAGHDGAYLTDSMVVMSLIPSTHHTTLISVPRDLWVQYPPNSGNYTKINAVYPLAAGDTNTKPVAGGNAAAQKVSLITGLQINYWMTINFAGFRKFIDAIGGVDVNVPAAFTAKYPKNDNPSINASWITVHFSKGLRHMNGATAIIYARARYVLDNNAEGSDFARSQRQQLIMKAALTKLKDWHNWFNLYAALDALKQTMYSNLSLADLAQFALKMDLNNAHRLGLTNENVLVDATSNDGQAILLPRNNDWQAIVNYINHGLYQ